MAVGYLHNTEHTEQSSTPGTPDTGNWRVYFKSDGLYVLDDAGTEYGPMVQQSAAGPSSAQYLTLATNSTLTAERTLALDDGLVGSDGGAGGAYTVGLDFSGMTMEYQPDPNADLLIIYDSYGTTVKKITVSTLTGIVPGVTSISSSANTSGAGVYLVDTTSAALTVTLDTADARIGQLITIKDAGGNAGANNITVDTEGSETIDGASSTTISTNYGVLRLVCDANNGDWHII